jgi:hypothetical protein
MQYLRGAWAWYLARKLWQKIVIGILILSAIFAPFSEDTATTEVSVKSSDLNSPKATPSEQPTPYGSPSATESSTPVPVSPTELRSSALGDLADMRKDVADGKRAIEQGGILRLYGNSLELYFNLGQLQSIYPSEDIADKWNSKLLNLETAIDIYSDGLSTDSVTKSRANLDKILYAISSLEKFVKAIK